MGSLEDEGTGERNSPVCEGTRWSLGRLEWSVKPGDGMDEECEDIHHEVVLRRYFQDSAGDFPSWRDMSNVTFTFASWRPREERVARGGGGTSCRNYTLRTQPISIPLFFPLPPIPTRLPLHFLSFLILVSKHCLRPSSNGVRKRVVFLRGHWG